MDSEFFMTITQVSRTDIIQQAGSPENPYPLIEKASEDEKIKAFQKMIFDCDSLLDFMDTNPEQPYPAHFQLKLGRIKQELIVFAESIDPTNTDLLQLVEDRYKYDLKKSKHEKDKVAIFKKRAPAVHWKEKDKTPHSELFHAMFSQMKAPTS